MSEHKSFFRQGGWMVMATLGSGLFMMLVHSATANMELGEYGVFVVLLRCLILIGIPVAGLQTVFAQQAAAAIDEGHRRQLATSLRVTLGAVFVAWLIMVGTVLVFQKQILATLKITQPLALWMMLAVALTTLWIPALKGILQGEQNFLGLGWSAILDGLGRFASVVVIVSLLGGLAAGAMTGALIGQIISLGAAIWWTRHVFKTKGEAFEWRPWLRRVVPLTIGTGAVTFLSTMDSLFVQSLFDAEQTPFYMAGFLVGFALMQFTIPLALVMFPKIVAGRASAKKTDALRLTLLSTVVMGATAAYVATIWPELPLKVLYFRSPKMHAAAPLVPWFAWCILFLTVANVLINNLLAHERFEIVPWLIVIAVGYGVALYCLKDIVLHLEMFQAYRTIVVTLAAFNLAAFLLAAWFTWGRKGTAERAD